MIEGNSLNIDRWKTLCVSGHRSITTKINLKELTRVFNVFIDNGIDTFLVGMAIGFDTICFHILEKIRKTRQIRIIACIPCNEQDKLFTLSQKVEYKKMVASADEKIVLSDSYTPYCMNKRNRFMVDNSCVLVGYLTQNKGGTYSTVKYAKEQGLNCIIFPNYG